MTESEWMVSQDPAAMLAYLLEVTGSVYGFPADRDRKPSERKLRLFADACRHSFFHGHLVQSGIWSGWESDGHMESRLRDEKLTASAAASAWASEGALGEHPFRAALLRDLFNPFRPVEPPHGKRCGCYSGVEVNDRTNRHYRPDCGATRPCHECGGSKWTKQPAAWLTPTVRALAEACYSDRDETTGHLSAARLCVLADALEEAGCHEQAILTHLRGESCPYCKDADFATNDLGGQMMGGQQPYAARAAAYLNMNCVCKGTRKVARPHYRGCWAADCILGRS